MALPFRTPTSSGIIQAHIDRVLPAYAAYLGDRGCAPGSLSNLTRTARHMLAWLKVNKSHFETLDIRAVDGFLSHGCVCPADFRSKLNKHSRSQAQRLLGYLIETGQAAVPSAIVTGGQLVAAFTDSLTTQGYCESRIRFYQTSCRHLVVWLYRSDLALAEIDGSVLRRFLDHDCACAHPQFFCRPGAFCGSRAIQATIGKFASYLIDRGVVAEWRDPDSNANRGGHFDAFLSWLRQHRGLQESTVRHYERSLHKLLKRLGDDPGTYDVASIRTAIRKRAQSPSRAAHESTALRSYLRFLAANGLCRSGLASAVPASRGRPVSKLPRYVEEQDIEALIASCDTSTAIGLRDRAILLLLARLALRSGDITALQLGDIDWERALIRVSGKSRRSVSLPLPQDAGNAVKDYIVRARPHIGDATVFLRSLAPHGGLTSSTVTDIARRAMKRARIEGEGLPAAHLLRHSRATHLLRGGTSLEAISALLRHQSVNTTAIYARVDVPMLLAVAQPWPEERQ